MNTSLGERLAKLRKSQGLTQEIAAQTLGIPRGTYSMYELGRREPDAETLYRIATMFDVTVDYLISGWSIGKQIQEHRIALGLTVEQLAISVGVSEQEIIHIEEMPGEGQIENPYLLASLAVELFNNPRDFILNSKQISRYKALEYLTSDGSLQMVLDGIEDDSSLVSGLPEEHEFIEWTKLNVSKDFFKDFQMSNDKMIWKTGLEIVYEMQKRQRMND